MNMARKPRFNICGFAQHIIQRGNNREPCFFEEVDYQCDLDVLHEMADRNQFHLLVTPFAEYPT